MRHSDTRRVTPKAVLISRARKASQSVLAWVVKTGASMGFGASVSDVAAVSSSLLRRSIVLSSQIILHRTYRKACLFENSGLNLTFTVSPDICCTAKYVLIH